MYSLLMLVFFTMSLLVLVFILFKMSFSSKFLSKFINLSFLMFFMVGVNCYCMVESDMGKCMIFLILLSFYSLFLMGFGYGVGEGLSLMIVFKVFADVLLYVLMGYFYFFKLEGDIDLGVWGSGFLKTHMDFLLMSIFSIYSLLGIFGFWVFWAMEASYFVSVYMHSCGFMSVGMVLFFKLVILGATNFENSKNFMYMFSLMSYLFFVNLFLTVKDAKKSFGYFSASSISFLFLISLISPTSTPIYFFMSSMMKVFIFELMSFMNKSKLGWWGFFWLCVLYLSNYSMFVMMPAMWIGDDLIKITVFLIFFIKVYCLSMFLVSISMLFEDLKVYPMSESPLKILFLVFLLFFCLLFLLMTYFSDLGVFSYSLYSWAVKHIFLLGLYLFYMQILFMSGFPGVLLMESFKILMNNIFSLMSEFKINSMISMFTFNFNMLMFLSGNQKDLTMSLEILMLLFFMLFLWMFS